MIKNQNSTIRFREYSQLADLSENIQNLMSHAIEVRKNAYAPYSNFQVGAALLLENGSIVVGSNQENAAYPSGLCAERTAIFAAGATHPGVSIVALAISAAPKDQENQQPVAPCGACRQSLLEYEIKQQHVFPVFFMGSQGPIIEASSVESLLPFAFSSF